MKCILIIFIFLSTAGSAFAQCAPGIPSAGNPGCIPPDQMGSPYNSEQPQAEQREQVRWADSWGSLAVATDPRSSQAGFSENVSSEADATAQAIANCERNGPAKCATSLTYHNQCVAAAQQVGGGRLSMSTAASQDGAKERALDHCGGGSSCSIVYQGCSVPKRLR
jgi:hypothetical protein